MRKALFALVGAATLAGCVGDGGYADRGPGYGNNRGSGYAGNQQGDYRRWRQYDYNRPDPAYGSYDAGRYYRDDPRYRERRVSDRERVYRGQDGRYYCRRSDGTTGLIVGALAGGLLGNIIAPGGSETLGTVLGAGGGALAGRAIDRNNVRCR